MMKRVLFFLFSVWFLMLPFSALSSIYFSIAGLAFDKVLAPLLILLWFGLLLSGQYSLSRKKKLLITHVFIFFVIRNVSFMGNYAVFMDVAWRDVVLFGYFTLPMLYINNLKRVNVASKLISVSAVVACLSAFLVAVGVMELPYERFSESRIGFEGIKKSIGLISSYGDVTQLAAFFLLLGLFMPEKVLPVGRKSRSFVKLAVLVVIILGLIGNQSRSYLLSLIASFGVALFFYYRSKSKQDTLLIDLLVVLSAVFILPLMIYMMNEISTSLAGIGGREAMGSARARLLQYEVAFSLIKENPLFGIDSDFYIKNEGLAHGIHNMWLGQLTRGGIVSVLLLVVFMVVVFRDCINLFKNENIKAYAKVLTGYLAAVFVSILFYPADSDIFWALLGTCVSMIYVLSSERADKPEKISMENKLYFNRSDKNRIIPKKVTLKNP